jgi:hypothetical protein
MTISGYPIFVMLPEISSLSAVVYGANNTATGNFVSPATAFAAYFGMSTGCILFTATAPATIRYFVFKIPSSSLCWNYYLSSRRAANQLCWKRDHRIAIVLMNPKKQRSGR